MDIVILDSAYKHGITEQSIHACLFNVRGGELLTDPPLKQLLVGFDHLGNAIELITIDDEERNLLIVIHAMKLQKKYEYLLGVEI